MNHQGRAAPGRDVDLLLRGGSVAGLEDGPLLDRIVAGSAPEAEAAFAALMRRHGPMVARVCGGILGDAQLAEDAAQAVFLVLLRRARSIRDPGQLAPWLHGVALRTARETRRRRFIFDPIPRDDPTMFSTVPDPTQAAVAREQAELLHRAINRLPARDLAPVVLCDLEGLTHAEAAQRLGCPTSTVSIRLTRARAKLRAHLARHRLDFEAVLPPVVAGSVPRSLVASASARALADRVLGIASAAQWKAIAAAALVAGVAAVGAVGAQPGRQDPPAAGQGGANPPATVVAPQDPPVVVVPKEAPPRRGALRIARLHHAGDRDAASLALPNLTRALRDKLKPHVVIDQKDLFPTDPNLVHYPLLYLQGRAEFAFGADDLAALRRHLSPGGGTLFADAAGGSPAFDASFRRFVADLLPDGKLEPIPATDALYHRKLSDAVLTSHIGNDLSDARRTAAAGGGVGYPELEGIKVNGWWVVIYSKLDIGCALAGQVDAECRGYTPESATRIATNVVIYAMTDGPPVPPAAEVTIGLPTVRNVTDFKQYVGRVAASRTVEVRPQVDGIVRDVKVAEGDLVQAGQTLFEIDRREVPSDTAEIETARTRVAQAKTRLDRIMTDSRNPDDPAVRLSQSGLDHYTRELEVLLAAKRPSVAAPFAGQVARRLADVGTTVEAGKTPLATVAAVDPVLVDFEMDEQTFLKIRRWIRTKPGTTHLPVHVGLRDEEGFPHAGRVLFQAGRFNPETGTCTLHAELPNPDHALIPGLSAQIRVEYGDPRRALLVPEAAIITDQGRKFLRGTDAGGSTDRRRPVAVGSLYDGYREVKEGIDAMTWVVFDPAKGVDAGGPPPR